MSMLKTTPTRSGKFKTGLLFIFLSSSSIAQPAWETVHLSENVSVKMPAPYNRQDTLGQDNIFVTGDLGYIQAVRIPNPEIQLQDRKDLRDYYSSYQNQSVKQNHGVLISDSTVKIGDLVAHGFVFEAYWQDSLEVQEHLIVFIKHNLYSFAYGYNKGKRTIATAEKDRFFSSISISDVGYEDQLTMPPRNTEPLKEDYMGVFIQWFFFFSLMAVFLWPAFRLKNIAQHHGKKGWYYFCAGLLLGFIALNIGNLTAFLLSQFVHGGEKPQYLSVVFLVIPAAVVLLSFRSVKNYLFK